MLATRIFDFASKARSYSLTVAGMARSYVLTVAGMTRSYVLPVAGMARSYIGLFASNARSYNVLQAWAAFGASQGLGVEAAVRRGFVFGAAVVTERKISHRGVGPVVGHGRDDGVARAALGAIDKGVAVAPLSWIVQLFHAVVTGVQVRWQVDLGRTGVFTGKDLESSGWFELCLLRQRKLRAGQRRG